MSDAMLNRMRMRHRNELRWGREGSPTAPEDDDG